MLNAFFENAHLDGALRMEVATDAHSLGISVEADQPDRVDACEALGRRTDIPEFADAQPVAFPSAACLLPRARCR